jgi:hypothetical protein
MGIKSKILMSVFLVGTTILTALPANAKWVQLAEDNDGTRFYIENEKVMVQNNTVYYWRRIDSPYPVSGITSSRVRYEANCLARSQKELEGVFYNGRRVVGKQVFNENSSYVGYGTYAELMFNQACALRQQRY